MFKKEMSEHLKRFGEGTFAQTEKIKFPFLVLFIVTLIFWLSFPVFAWPFGLVIVGIGWLTCVGTFIFVLSDLICLVSLQQKRFFCLKRLVVLSLGFLLLTKGHQFRHDRWFLHQLKPKFEQALSSWRTNKARLTAAPVQQTVVVGFLVFGNTNTAGKVRAVFQLPQQVPRENFLYAGSNLSTEELKDHRPIRMITTNWYYFN
ncbi:MAG: hypothetical protein ABIP71_15700 [Verrucomicrobiota bacterium]